jgi:hypothetical protein
LGASGAFVSGALAAAGASACGGGAAGAAGLGGGVESPQAARISIDAIAKIVFMGCLLFTA